MDVLAEHRGFTNGWLAHNTKFDDYVLVHIWLYDFDIIIAMTVIKVK